MSKKKQEAAWRKVDKDAYMKVLASLPPDTSPKDFQKALEALPSADDTDA